MKLLGAVDLAKRWNYTKQGVHIKMKKDRNFPQPVSLINNNIKVFLEEDIIAYETGRRELHDAKYKHWYTHQRWLYVK